MRKRKFQTICGITSYAGFFIMLGATGGSDTGTLTLGQSFWMATAWIALFAGGCYLGGYIE